MVTSERDWLRATLGSVGVWTFAFDELPAERVRRDAASIETMGYPALWVPEGGTSREIFAHLSLLLGATDRVAVCSGIANITARHPEAMAGGARTLTDAYPERVVLGIGVGHQTTTARRGQRWEDPVARVRRYLDEMDAARPGPDPAVHAPRRLLAALGPRMLDVAAERALGAHSYFVPVAHTAFARDRLGAEPVLAVEQTVVLSSDPADARRIARGWAAGYLDLPNYAANLRRLGFSGADVAGGGSDDVIDATIAWGDVDAIVARVRAHLDAGADHVCVQAISARDADACLPQLRELAGPLLEL